MSEITKVYKVKDLKTGMYRTGGGSYNSVGKTWNHLGHLKSSLSNEGWNRDGKTALPSRDIVIVEIIVQETPGNTTILADFIEQQRRYRDLEKKHGGSFSDLVKRIEKDGQQDLWTWALLIPYTIGRSADWEKVVTKQLRDSKLKMNTDYRKAASQGLAIAFKDRKSAMLLRLALPSEIKVISLDIQNFVEADIDTEEP